MARATSGAQMAVAQMAAPQMTQHESAYAPEPARAPAQVEAPLQQYAPQSYAPAQSDAQAYAPHHADVQITRVAQQPYREPAPAPQQPRAIPAPQVYIPPQAEQPQSRRMPSVDDLPLPGQNLLRAQAPAEAEPESRRRTLLERLANFGMSRADELRAHQGVASPAQRIAPPQGYAPPQPSSVHQEYAKRPQQRLDGGTDAHGRALPRPEEDQLEIPAFLRRQSR
jgi:cell division protein FtsZ